MTFDREKVKKLLENIDELFDAITFDMKKEHKDILKKLVLGPAIAEVEKLVYESRPPVILFMGRSGHGKSSLINVLANKNVAEVNDFRPQTPQSEPYVITFGEEKATWKVVDTRGIFETTKPEGSVEDDAVEVLKTSIIKNSPDVILHVISTPETRNLSNDLDLYKKLSEEIKSINGTELKTLIVLTKADTFKNPREWPPMDYPRKAGQLTEVLDYMVEEVFKGEKSSINSNFPYLGYRIHNNNTYIGIIPVSGLEEEPWNINTLSNFVADNLAEEAKLDFLQATRNKEQLRKISSAIIKRFSTIAGGIGASPVPADVFILTPLQMLMVGIIAALSGREVSKDTIMEFLAAAGVNVGVGYGLREGARQLTKLIPGVGLGVSAGVAAFGTYAIGKSAETYFFYNKMVKPENIEK
ncbi:GTPase family protein [Bacillus sinesaloumensis]|uniref:GTPase family protein n=1 Tax=Litchfieldia sinesaloumensis TaxID=1926280 RepID=UPI0009883253|nr:GTPase [Bacillus sinesaloumensis]